MYLKEKMHHRVMLDVSANGFDRGVASFGSLFVDEEDTSTRFLYFAGGHDEKMINSAIGLAVSNDGVKFKKVAEPILSAPSRSFCFFQMQTPIVTKLHNEFFMVLSGKPSLNSTRRIGIAYADDPRGPWHIIDELIKPTHLWEGNGIDNGPSIAKLDSETILLYYSSITSTKSYDVGAILRRYPIRRIGLLKVRIRGPSPHQIEAMRCSGNPLKHLNGSKGSWNESVFCPGYTKIGGMHYLFPTGSTYSIGFPYKQYIGTVTSNSPNFIEGTCQMAKLIDGPLEKTQIMPNIKGELAIDTASPYLDLERRKLYLYYSVADRADGKWKIALTTFQLAN